MRKPQGKEDGNKELITDKSMQHAGTGKEMHTKFWSENINEHHHLDNSRTYGRAI
jgi:hypothetical protein